MWMIVIHCFALFLELAMKHLEAAFNVFQYKVLKLKLVLNVF